MKQMQVQTKDEKKDKAVAKQSTVGTQLAKPKSSVPAKKTTKSSTVLVVKEVPKVKEASKISPAAAKRKRRKERLKSEQAKTAEQLQIAGSQADIVWLDFQTATSGGHSSNNWSPASYDLSSNSDHKSVIKSNEIMSTTSSIPHLPKLHAIIAWTILSLSTIWFLFACQKNYEYIIAGVLGLFSMGYLLNRRKVKKYEARKV